MTIRIVLKDEKGGRVPRVEISNQAQLEMMPPEFLELIYESGGDTTEEGLPSVARYDVEVVD